ncbi:MAG: hypothetical protein U0528_06545 [Anaerolineae bacterium]|nr:hypothetical protein [Anaerolineae bacterium]
MERETLETIHQLANERLQLYIMASHQRLADEQYARIDTITARLYTLWDQYRRELAANSRESQERVNAERRFSALAARRALAEDSSDNRAA